MGRLGGGGGGGGGDVAFSQFFDNLHIVFHAFVNVHVQRTKLNSVFLTK